MLTVCVISAVWFGRLYVHDGNVVGEGYSVQSGCVHVVVGVVVVLAFLVVDADAVVSGIAVPVEGVVVVVAVAFTVAGVFCRTSLLFVAAGSSLLPENMAELSPSRAGRAAVRRSATTGTL